MRRIVLGGDQLEASLPRTRMGVADHIKLVVPDETTGEVTLPEVGERGIVRPEGVELAIRDYTIRAFDPVARELTLDFVLHDHGPAGRWALRAAPGDPVGVMGPRGTSTYPSGYDRYVAGADETGLPAIERWIEEAPDDAALDVFVLVEDATRERATVDRAGLRLHWLHRSAGSDLAAALIAALPEDDGHTFVWAAGEATGMRPLQTHVREKGFDRRSFDIRGYWKLGEAGHEEGHGPGER